MSEANGKPKPTIRTSGGNPTGLPNYRPINKLPDAEIRALMKKTLRPALYQVRVEDIAKGDIAIGPKCPQNVAAALAGTIANYIRLGKEKTWSNPRVVLTL